MAFRGLRMLPSVAAAAFQRGHPNGVEVIDSLSLTFLVMPTLTQGIQFCGFGFILALAGTISTRLLTGSINSRGLLHSKSPSNKGSVSPARIQLLIFTLAIAGNYLSQVVSARTSLQLPDVPQNAIAALGGSHAVYLATKAYAFFLKPALSNVAGE